MKSVETSWKIWRSKWLQGSPPNFREMQVPWMNMANFGCPGQDPLELSPKYLTLNQILCKITHFKFKVSAKTCYFTDDFETKFDIFLNRGICKIQSPRWLWTMESDELFLDSWNWCSPRIFHIAHFAHFSIFVQNLLQLKAITIIHKTFLPYTHITRWVIFPQIEFVCITSALQHETTVKRFPSYKRCIFILID